MTDSRSLRLNEFGFDAVQEHFRRHIVASDRQLDERVAGKNHQTHFVIHHLVDQFAQHLFRAIQTVGSHVLGQHRITDIQCDNGFYTLPFLGMLVLSPLRTRSSDDEQHKGYHQNTEFHVRAHAAGIRHQRFHQFLIAKLLQLAAFAQRVPDVGCYENRHGHQQPQKFHICKSEHNIV